MEIKLIDFLYSIYWGLLELEYEHIERLACASAAKKVIDKTEDLEDFDDIILDVEIVNELLKRRDADYKIRITDKKTVDILQSFKMESLLELEKLNKMEKDYVVRKNN